MRENRWLPYAFVALVAAALYLQTLHFDYVFDDKPLIVQNAFLKEPWSPLRAFHHEFWYGTAFVGYYRPLVIASFALNGRILGWGPGWFHLVNVLLHTANAVMLLAGVVRCGASGPARFILRPARMAGLARRNPAWDTPQRLARLPARGAGRRSVPVCPSEQGIGGRISCGSGPGNATHGPGSGRRGHRKPG